MLAKLLLTLAFATLGAGTASAQWYKKKPRVPSLNELGGGVSDALKKARDDAANAAKKAAQDTENAAVKARQDAANAAIKAKQDTEKAALKAKQDAADTLAKAKRDTEKAALKAKQDAEEAAKKAGGDASRELKSAGRIISDEAKRLGGDVAAATKKKVGEGVEWLKSTPLWKYVTDRALSLFMESPRPIRVTADETGKALTGEPVYYVNGMFTPRATAVAEATSLATRVGRPVYLIVNASSMDGTTGTPTVADDLSEAVYDREWPANFATMNPVGLLPGLKLPNPPFAQLNPATRQLTHLLYHAGGPLDIVTHSQGCIQMRNALLAAGSLGKESNIRSRVAWVATGTPVNDNEVWPRPSKYRYLINADDPVPAVVGVRGGPKFWESFNTSKASARHEPTVNYFPRVTADMFFAGFGTPGKAGGGKTPVPPGGAGPPKGSAASVTLENAGPSPLTFEVGEAGQSGRVGGSGVGGFRAPSLPTLPLGVSYRTVTLAPKASQSFDLAKPESRLSVRYGPAGWPPRVVELAPGGRHQFQPLVVRTVGLVPAGPVVNR